MSDTHQSICKCTHKQQYHTEEGCMICLQYVQLKTEKCKAFEQTIAESVCTECKKYFNNPFGDLSVCFGCVPLQSSPFTPFVQYWEDEDDETGYIPPRGLYI